MKQAYKLVTLVAACTLTIGVTSALGLDMRPKQVLVEVKFLSTSFEDLDGLGIQFGLGWDANYLRRIPGLPKSES
jgi:hypothetical protein